MCPVSKSSRKGRHATGRVSREQWLEAALDAFELGGLQAVRVDGLAKTLKISRSGFYWHFKDRSDLLEAMKQYWVDTFTEAIVDHSEMVDASPEDRLRLISEDIVNSGANRYDLAFAAWARHDPAVAKLVASVAQFRNDYIGALLREAGFRGADLEARTRLFVVYHSWENTMYGSDAADSNGPSTAAILDVILAR